MVLQSSEAPEIEAEKWLNSNPVTLEEGVFVIDFWSYTCPDCSQAFQALSKIHEETSATVIGVHAPHFGFEESHHIEKTLEKRSIEQPVAVDSDKSVWKDYGNRERPRQVIVKDGEVAWKNAGNSESIENALKKALEVDELPDLDLEKSHSPMIELGYSNVRGINDDGNFRGEKEFEMPTARNMNRVYLSGRWKQTEDYLEAVEEAVLKIKFRASEINIIAESSDSGTVEVLLDSSEPEEKKGEDLEEGVLKVDHPDVYSIVETGDQEQTELTLRPDQGIKLYGISFR